MAIKLLPDGFLSDSFQIGEDPYVLKDALIVPVSYYDALTPDEVQAMKQARYDNWYAIVTAPPTEEPTADPAV